MQKIFKMLLVVMIMSSGINSHAKDPIVNTGSVNTYNEEKLNISVTSKEPTFSLDLKSNPTTGYNWFLREYNENLIEPIKREIINNKSKLIGASIIERWTFKIKPAGFIVPHQTTIRMIYARPFQGNEGANQLTYRVSTLS